MIAFAAPAAAATACTGTLGAVTINGPLVVVGSGTCTLLGTTVTGAVIVSSGGSLVTDSGAKLGGITSSGAVAIDMNFTTVSGNVLITKQNSDGEAPNVICADTIKGSLSVTDSSSSSKFIIGDLPADDACRGANTITGNVTIVHNQASTQLSDSTVGGSVVFASNGVGTKAEELEFDLGGNTIGASLACSANVPAPDDAASSTVGGSRTGQCA